MKTILSVVAVCLVLAMLVFLSDGGCDKGCTDKEGTIKTLNNSGYTDIKTGGYSWFECGEDDTYHTEFTATNPKGKVVSGTVCCGLWSKGCTIRY